jgi:transcription termination factor Rho
MTERRPRRPGASAQRGKYRPDKPVFGGKGGGSSHGYGPKKKHGGGYKPSYGHKLSHAQPSQPQRDREPAPNDLVPLDSHPDSPPVTHEGVLELHLKGYGFLRTPAKNYVPQPGDPYVGQKLIDKYQLREGLLLSGPLERGQSGDTRLADISLIEGKDAASFVQRSFDELTPIDPHEAIKLETGPEPLTTRVMEILTPIGRGQRGLIVAPPRTGKTILLQHIAQAVAKNHPDMHLVVLLIDERPEEVTEMRRTVKGEVIASSSDRDSVAHTRIAELAVERARRLAEQGKSVFVLLDSLTRLARAYNKNTGAGGRTMSGGVDVRALEVPKRLFGTARVFEEGGSLTVLGTALIETGSRMDEVIFQEFKGTGNMELVLDRKLAERRVFPAIDLLQSGTRKEERLLTPENLARINLLRRSLSQLNPIAAMELLVKKLGEYPTNSEFLDKVATFLK